MNLRLSVMLVAGAALASMATALNAAPVFYLSDMPLGTASPGVLNSSVAPGAVGQIGIFATSDVRLSGVSLNLAAVGNGIQFTGASVSNPNSRWTFAENPMTTESKVTSIGGGAIPFVSGNGIGPAGEVADATSGYLIGTVNYTASLGGSSDLFLQVGGNTIADWDGNNIPVIFGPGSLSTDSAVPNATDSMFDGRISVLVSGVGPTVANVFGATTALGDVISLMPMDTTGDPAPTWSELTGPTYTPGFGAPGDAPGLGASTWSWNAGTQAFEFSTLGSTRGTYVWTGSATNATGSDPFSITVEVQHVPEPATLSLFGLALVGLFGFRRLK